MTRDLCARQLQKHFHYCSHSSFLYISFYFETIILKSFLIKISDHLVQYPSKYFWYFKFLHYFTLFIIWLRLKINKKNQTMFSRLRIKGALASGIWAIWFSFLIMTPSSGGGKRKACDDNDITQQSSNDAQIFVSSTKIGWRKSKWEHPTTLFRWIIRLFNTFECRKSGKRVASGIMQPRKTIIRKGI